MIKFSLRPLLWISPILQSIEIRSVLSEMVQTDGYNIPIRVHFMHFLQRQQQRNSSGAELRETTSSYDEHMRQRRRLKSFGSGTVVLTVLLASELWGLEGKHRRQNKLP
jgi:hypothetical protein